MKQELTIIALFGAIAFPFAVYADPPMELEIVTPARMPQQLDKSIADTTVLNQQQIHDSGAPDVPTLLRSLAGVEIVQAGGLGEVSGTFMRGTNSNQVLVLLDGVRINSATTGTTALEHIMLDNVERIEVVRGNVSSLYGSEAIGGVIQIFTKRGLGAPAFNASAGLGSHGTQRMSAGYSGSADATTFSVNIGRVKTDGVSAINTGIATTNPDKDGYDNITIEAQVTHAINADHQLSASMFGTQGDSQYDTFYDAYFNPTAITDRNKTKAAIYKISVASDDRLNELWHSNLKLARGTDDSRDYLNDVQDSRFKTVNNQLTWQNNLKLADSQQVALAGEYLGQDVSSDTMFTQTSRSVRSLFGGYIGEFGAQQMQFNLRQDRYSDFGSANTGLLGYGLSFAEVWRITASISNAFKAPTFNDMYYPFQNFGGGYTYSGNPDLQPERSQNKEAGLHYAAHDQRVDVIYFNDRISDLIACNPGCSTVVNIDQAQIDGEEFSYAGQFGNTRLKANATFQNPRDTNTGQVLLRRAKRYSNVAASHDWGTWGLGAEVRYSGVRQDYDLNGSPVTLTSYTLLNLTARYKIDRNLNLSFSADNVFDRDYSEVYAYNTPGRTLFIGLNYQQ